MAPIIINGNMIDPAKPRPGQLPLDASKTHFILLQCTHRLTVHENEELEKLGVQIQSVEGETPNATSYLCRYDKSDLKALEKVYVVQHALVYVPEFVIDSSLKGRDDEPAAAGDIPVTITLHAGTEQSGKDLLQAIQKIDKGELVDASEDQLRVRLPYNSLEKVAKLDYVKAIERTKVIETRTAVAHGVLHAGLPPPGLTRALRGKGEVIAVADQGLDLGDINNIHPAFKTLTGETRVLGILNASGDPNYHMYDLSGHGTHVAGCAVGLFEELPKTPDVPYNINSVKAPAHEAHLVFQTIMAGDNIAPDLTTLFMNVTTAPYNARIHTNSWGTRSLRTYQEPYTNAESVPIDRAMARDKRLLIVWAAGNDGTKLTKHKLSNPLSGESNQKFQRQIGAEAASKNVITVGGTMNSRRVRAADDTHCLDGTEPDRVTAPVADQDALWSESSKGPTCEFRLKPDVVAPAAVILSARTRQLQRSAGSMSEKDILENWRIFHTGSGQVPSDNFTFLSGTSQAAPMVASCAAVLRQGLKMKPRGPIAEPSGALVKALLVNGARDLANHNFQTTDVRTGIRATFVMPASPNTAQGFGAVDLDRSLKHIFPVADGEGDALDFNPLPQGAAVTFNIAVPPGKTNLKITMAYTDKEGKVMQDFLDLTVSLQNAASGAWSNDIGPDRYHYLPWQRDPAGPAPNPDIREPLTTDEPTGLFFAHNNVQRITCAVAGVSNVRVRVFARSVTPISSTTLGHAVCWIFS